MKFRNETTASTRQENTQERGVLVRTPEAKAFCGGLVELINDKALRSKMAVRGRAFVEYNHSMERFKDVVNLYSSGKDIDSSVSWKDSGVAL